MTSIFKPPPITTAQRTALLLESGELVFDSDEQIPYWGDGVTVGGNRVNVSTYTFNQVSASLAWNVTHNLARNPAVTVIDTAGDQVIGDVVYNTANDLTVTFSSPIAGVAYLT